MSTILQPSSSQCASSANTAALPTLFDYFDTNLFVESERLREDDLVCSVCAGVLRKATETNCGHLFCAECIRKCIATQGCCPSCRTKIKSFETGTHPNLRLDSQIGRLRTHCITAGSFLMMDKDLMDLTVDSCLPSISTSFPSTPPRSMASSAASQVSSLSPTPLDSHQITPDLHAIPPAARSASTGSASHGVPPLWSGDSSSALNNLSAAVASSGGESESEPVPMELTTSAVTTSSSSASIANAMDTGPAAHADLKMELPFLPAPAGATSNLIDSGSASASCPGACTWQGCFSDLPRHLQRCEFYPIRCQYHLNGCRFSGQRRVVREQHSAHCSFAFVPCPLGCGKPDLMRKDLEYHTTSECGEQALVCDMDECRQPLTRKRRRHHLDSECMHANTECPFSHVGCAKRMKRRDLQSHLQSSLSDHLQLTVKELQTTRQELQEVKSNSAMHSDQLKKVVMESFELLQQKQVHDKAARQQALFEQAQQFYQSKRYSQALEILVPLSKESHPESLFRLGFMYSNGLGVPLNPMRAYELFAQASRHGVRDAMVNIGILYEYKKITPEADYVEAVRWYAKAEEHSSPEGTYNLARLYESGVGGLRKNPAKALSLYQLAMQRGFVGARPSVARLIATLPQPLRAAAMAHVVAAGAGPVRASAPLIPPNVATSPNSSSSSSSTSSSARAVSAPPPSFVSVNREAVSQAVGHALAEPLTAYAHMRDLSRAAHRLSAQSSSITSSSRA